MRLIEGSDLRGYLRSVGAMAPDDALRLASQIGGALDAAHAAGLIHRDVKPANILLADTPQSDHPWIAYLGDFGLSRTGAVQQHLTQSGELLGTLEYMAPEQFTGDEIDVRADIYSLGCVLFECLTGRPPFARPTAMATAWAQVQEPLPRASELCSTVDGRADEVLWRALSVDRKDRPASALQLARELDGACARPAVTSAWVGGADRTLTMLFTDVEGSTWLLGELGERYGARLEEHRTILRRAAFAHNGTEVDTQGDAFFFVFLTALAGVQAAVQGQRELEGTPLKVRMGIQTGEPTRTPDGFVGIDVHRAARICSAGNGGQIVVSETTARLISEPELRPLGRFRLKDLAEPQRLYQVGDGHFPPIRALADTSLPVATLSMIGRRREMRWSKTLSKLIDWCRS